MADKQKKPSPKDATAEAKPKADTKPKATEKPKQKKEKTAGDTVTADKPKDGLNEATRKAGLVWNVNKFKDWIKEQFTSFGLDDDSHPKISHAHTALSAACEAMCTQIMNVAETNLKKEKSGLYNLSKAGIAYGIQFDSALNYTFYHSLCKFDQDTDYRNQFCIPQADVSKFVEKKFSSSNIKLDGTGYNVLAYLLNAFSVRLTKTALEFMTCSKSKSLRPNQFLSAVRIHTQEPVTSLLVKKIEDAVKLAGPEESDDNEAEAEAEPEEGEKADKPEKNAKKEKDAPKKAPAKKDAAKKEVEEDAEEVVEEADEEEVEEKPAKKETASKAKKESKPAPKK